VQNSANIRCSFRATKQGYIRGFKYVHIYGHMDQFLPWNQLSLMQQLNCVCNTLAKKALSLAIISGYHDRPTQILPSEDVVLVIWGNKVTGDISTPLHFHASKEVARNYLRTCMRDKWPNKCFEEVDWEHLELALKTSPTCIKSGDLSRRPDSVELESGSESILKRRFQTNVAPIVEDRKRPHTLCYVQTKIGQGF
jgi:hypothetical protein